MMNSEEKEINDLEVKLIPKLSSEISEDNSQKKQNTESGKVKDSLPNLTQFDVRDIVPNRVEKEFNLQASQETTRSQLATFLVRILSRTIIASFSLVIVLLIMSIFIDDKKTSSFDKTSALVKDLITVILTSQIGLVGTALGFYFGSKSDSD